MRTLLRVACIAAGAAVGAALAQAPAPAPAPEGQRLSKAEVKALFTDNEMTATNPAGLSFTEQYAADGTFKASTVRRDGSCCATDTGRWSVEGNMLCKQYANWQGGQLRCSYVVRDPQGAYTTGGGMRMVFKRSP